MPFLAVTLLIMNNKSEWVGRHFRSRWVTNVVLTIVLLFFGYVGVTKAIDSLQALF